VLHPKTQDHPTRGTRRPRPISGACWCWWRSAICRVLPASCASAGCTGIDLPLIGGAPPSLRRAPLGQTLMHHGRHGSSSLLTANDVVARPWRTEPRPPLADVRSALRPGAHLPLPQADARVDHPSGAPSGAGRPLDVAGARRVCAAVPGAPVRGGSAASLEAPLHSCLPSTVPDSSRCFGAFIGAGHAREAAKPCGRSPGGPGAGVRPRLEPLHCCPSTADRAAASPQLTFVSAFLNVSASHLSDPRVSP
jgi:hypothetical protein